jgi:branched-chain amino acid transport system permease protein
VLAFDGIEPLSGASSRRSLVIGLALLAPLVAYGLLGRQLFVLNSLATIFFYIVLAQAWNVLGGYGGYLNFGMATFVGVGAYTSAILWHQAQLSPFLTAPVAGLVAAIAGVLIGIPALRVRGAFFALMTMIVGFAAQILAFDLPLTQGALGIFLPSLPLAPLGKERLFYLIFLLFAAAVTALAWLLERSNIGWALVAIREDEDAAEVAGVRTLKVKTIANAFACFIAGMAGALHAQRLAYIEPTATFSFDVSLNVVLMTVIGGAGSWLGPLIGAPVVLLSGDLLRIALTSEINRAIFGALMIVVALLVPGGIVGMIKLRRRTKAARAHTE